MSLEWNSYTIGESCELITGFPFKSKYYLDNSTYNVVRGDNVKEGFIKWDDKKRCWDKLNDKLKKVLLKEEDIVIGMDGSKVGKNRAIISKKDLPALLAQRVACVRAKEGFNQNYIKYVILSNYFESYVDKVKTGTSIPHISLGQISEFTFEAPNYKNQKIISNILSNLDKKISINQEINHHLEQLSQNLFKKWFIDFHLENDFNIYEPLKDSSLGKIPKSWEIKTIGDLSIVKGRIGWRGYTTNDLVDEGPWVVGGKEITSGFIDFSTAKHLTREKYEESPEIMLKDKDLIIAKTGTIGPIAMFYETYGESTLNPNVGLIRSEKIAPALLLTFFKTPRAQYYLNEFTTSSVQPAINQTTIKQLEIALPSDKQLLDKLGVKFEEINLMQFNLNEEIKKLQKLRDTLLPKLMSGEIDVSKLNCDLKILIRKFILNPLKYFMRLFK